MIKFKSKELNLLVESGKFVDEQSRAFIKAALGLKKVKVVAKRHNILSGGPGVGKTYGAVDEANKGKVKYIMVEPGSSDVQIAIKLACAVYGLKKDEELIVIIDDADELVFAALGLTQDPRIPEKAARTLQRYRRAQLMKRQLARLGSLRQTPLSLNLKRRTLNV